MEVSTPQPGGLTKRPTVLVVDDEEAVTELFARLLVREGYAVEVAHDGASALTRVAVNPPDVILMDVMMPGLDGLAVCRRVKRDPHTRLTPIVLVTALMPGEHRIADLRPGPMISCVSRSTRGSHLRFRPRGSTPHDRQPPRLHRHRRQPILERR